MPNGIGAGSLARTVRLSMRALFFSAFVILSGAAFAAGSKTFEIPGFSISALSDPGGEEWWMPSTKPFELSRYALTNETVTHPIAVTILHYASPQQAKETFEMSRRGRPAAPEERKLSHWDAAHKWQKQPFRQVDICLLKGNYVVGVYDLPSDFSTEKTDRLLDALADNIAKAEPGGASNGSQPSRSETNRTSPAAGSGR